MTQATQLTLVEEKEAVSYSTGFANTTFNFDITGSSAPVNISRPSFELSPARTETDNPDVPFGKAQIFILAINFF